MGEIRTLISEKYKLKSSHFSNKLRNKTLKPLSSGRQGSQVQLYDKNAQPRGALEHKDLHELQNRKLNCNFFG